MSQRNSTSSNSSSSSHSNQGTKQYYILSNISSNQIQVDNETSLQSGSWKEPFVIEDEDLMFDGKPLNLLYEENKWVAEHEKVSFHFFIG